MQIAKMAGTSVAMIEKHYFHMTDDDMREMLGDKPHKGPAPSADNIPDNRARFGLSINLKPEFFGQRAPQTTCGAFALGLLQERRARASTGQP